MLLGTGDVALLGTASGSASVAAFAWDGTDLNPVVIATFAADGYAVATTTDAVVAAVTDVDSVDFGTCGWRIANHAASGIWKSPWRCDLHLQRARLAILGSPRSA